MKKFKVIESAHVILTDPLSKKDYDRKQGFSTSGKAQQANKKSNKPDTKKRKWPATESAKARSQHPHRKSRSLTPETRKCRCRATVLDRDPANSAYSEEEHKPTHLRRKTKTDGYETQAPMNRYNTRPLDIVDEEESTHSISRPLPSTRRAYRPDIAATTQDSRSSVGRTGKSYQVHCQTSSSRDGWNQNRGRQ